MSRHGRSATVLSGQHPHGTPRGTFTSKNRRKAAKRRENRRFTRVVHNGVKVVVTPSTRSYPGFG